MNIAPIAAAAGIVATQTNPNVQLVAEPNTPLAVLANMFHSAVSPEARMQAQTPEEMAALIEATWKGLQSENFGVLFANTAEHLIKTTTATVGFIQNTVHPIIERIATKLEEKANTPINIISDFRLVEFEIPEPLKDVGFEENFKKYDVDNLKEINRFVEVGGRSRDEILEVMATGNPSLDKAIGNWFTLFSEETAVEIWEIVFNSETPSVSLPMVFMRYQKQSLTPLDVGLAVWLIANGLAARRPNDIKSPRYFEECISEIEYYAGVMVGQEIQRISQDMANAKIIVQYLEDYEQIERGFTLPGYCAGVVVYKDAYRDWLTRGGTLEVLVGARLKTNNQPIAILDANTLYERRAEFHAAYHQYNGMVKSRSELRSLEVFKDTLSGLFMTELEVLTDSEKSLTEGLSSYREKVIELMESEIRALTMDATRVHPENNLGIYRTVSDLVCTARFYYHPNAGEYMRNMLSFALEAEDPYEASTRAMDMMVGEYLLQFMRVE